MLSIICVYNDEKILQNVLEKSLVNQKNCQFEKIFINSEKYHFDSASDALNFGGKAANGDFLIFVHQDVNFEDPFSLSKLESLCNRENFGVAGVAGISTTDGESYSNIFHGLDKHFAAKNFDLKTPVEASSLDECLLIIPKFIFNNYQFSYLGRTWHLYGTDYVLKMKQLGQKSLIFPISLWHQSNGVSLNLNYFDTIKKLCYLYNSEGNIQTLFGLWPTNKIYLSFKIFYRKLRFNLLGK